MTKLRSPAPVEKPVVLTIAGSDSGGGAGIQADLKTIEATGGFGTSAVTAATAQNTCGVESTHVLPIEEITAQIDAVRSDFDVQAIKTGMLATAEVVERVAVDAAAAECPVVVDPVMVAATGDRLLTEAAESAYGALIPEATLVTPNADEAAVLTDTQPTDEASARAAGRELLAMGADAALVKGGHIPGDGVIDVLVTNSGSETMRHPRIDTDATHGSGCTLSAAIATRLAHGVALPTAVERSTEFMERALRYHHAVGSGPGAVHHLAGIRNEASRNAAIETASDAADRLAELESGRILHESGPTVVAATAYAESIEDVVGITGRTRGERPRARFDVLPQLSGTLLDVREYYPEIRLGIGCRFDEDIEAAFAQAGYPILADHSDAAGRGPGTVVVPSDSSDSPEGVPSAILCSDSLDAALGAIGAAGKRSDTK